MARAEPRLRGLLRAAPGAFEGVWASSADGASDGASDGALVSAIDSPSRSALDAEPHQQTGPWWVLHTRARHEKAVANALAQPGIPHHLPLVTHERIYGHRRLAVDLPLLPGYLFVCGGAAEREAARRTNGVAAVLRVPDQTQFREEVQHIDRLVCSGEAIEVYSGLKTGQSCRVTGGSLLGIEGLVLKRRSRSRMYIAATILGQSAVVEIDCGLLEPLE